ncbi:glutathione peroxidase [uncultured Hymenobacter sp.]|uniref:glutathione peroxidase n=1 Tax=uncultured Hymenobacter sp. TaxID=170016 RepID=UPI0035C9FD4F
MNRFTTALLALAAAGTLTAAQSCNFFTSSASAAMNNPEALAKAGTVYDFTVKSIDGKDMKLSQFKGKKLLIVNTASECGFTPQYKELEQLYKAHGDKVTVLGFPANNFGGQEPGTEQQIAAFCEKNYGVTFPLFSKISVKGDDADPLYKFLADKSRNGGISEAPSWNFCKYLVDEQGHVVKFYPSKVTPMSPELLADISK